MHRTVLAMLDPQGPNAAAAADLWWLMLWLGLAVMLVFGGLLAVGLRRRVDVPMDPREATTGDDEQRATRWFVGWGVVGPTLVIGVVFGATLWAMRSTMVDPPEGAVPIEVVGRQFDYEVRYPDTGVVTSDELRLPVGEPVALTLLTDDVIHSFWVPELGGKMDMIPGRRNVLVLQADEVGAYVSRCAEFCGLEHARMELDVVAQSRADFDAWLAADGGTTGG